MWCLLAVAGLVACAPAASQVTRANPAALAQAIGAPYDYNAPVVPAACDVWFAQQKLGKAREYYRGGFVVAGGDPSALSLKLNPAVQSVFGPRANGKAWTTRRTNQLDTFVTKSWSASGKYWRNLNVVIVQRYQADPAVCVQTTS